MLYTGKIQKFTEIQTDDLCANPRKNFGWRCSCGENNDNIETYQQADAQLDSHMRQHWSKDARTAQYPSTKRLICHKDKVMCTETNEVGVVEDPTLEGARILVNFSGRRVRHPVDTLVLVREDPEDAIERPPDRDASHDVRHAVPSSQDVRQDAENVRSMLLVTFIDDPNLPGCTLGESRSIDSRWDLFTNEELQTLNLALDDLGTSGESLFGEVDDEQERRERLDQLRFVKD